MESGGAWEGARNTIIISTRAVLETDTHIFLTHFASELGNIYKGLCELVGAKPGTVLLIFFIGQEETNVFRLIIKLRLVFQILV